MPLPVHLLIKGLPADLVLSKIGSDLIEVACALFLADRMHVRSRDASRSRQIAVRLPVRQPTAWKRAAPLLEQALSILTDDVFSFDFYRSSLGAGCFPTQDMQKAEPHKILQRKNAARSDAPTINRVALFSGGLDSAVGAAYFARREDPTAYVTHYVRDIKRIEGLLKTIYSVYGEGKHPLHAQFYIKPQRTIAPMLREHSRRSRSFLFVALALATANALDAREVCVCENGVIALNLPFIPAMVPTRHAHSSFLHTMERLAAELFGSVIRVVNPFELVTKGEMCRIFQAHPQLALESVSCWNQQWSGRDGNYGKGHCGHCVPCLVRRVSLEAACIAIPKDHFDLDVLRLARRRTLTAKEFDNLRDYRALMSFIEQVRSCRSWRSFLRAFPDIIISEATMSRQSSDDWFRGLFNMMKRFAGEVDHSFSGV